MTDLDDRFGAKDLEAGPRTALHCAAQSGHLEVDGVGCVFGNGHGDRTVL